MSAMANVSRSAPAQIAMKNSALSSIAAAAVNITMPANATSERTRCAALKATTESSSKRRCSRASAPFAFTTRMAPRLSCTREVRSELASRATSERTRKRGENQRAQSTASTAMVTPITPSTGCSALTNTIAIAYCITCVATEINMPTMAVTWALSW